MQNNNELYHYGVLGMKWGVRRYSNKYGVLTKAGQEKRKKIESEYETLSNVKTLTPKGQQRKAQLASQYKELTGANLTAKKAAAKKQKYDDDADEREKVKNMTNEELQAHNFRKQLETTYLNSVSPKNSNINMAEIGRKRVQDLSNEELSAYNARKQLEATYTSFAPKKEISRGKKIVNDFVDKAIVPGAIAAGKKYTEKVLFKMLSGSDTKEAVKEIKDAVK